MRFHILTQINARHGRVGGGLALDWSELTQKASFSAAGSRARDHRRRLKVMIARVVRVVAAVSTPRSAGGGNGMFGRLARLSRSRGLSLLSLWCKERLCGMGHGV